jgi:hypothetical protein
MPFEKFDQSRLRLRPLCERTHDLDRSCLIFPESPRQPFEHEALPALAGRIVEASRGGRAVIFFCGAHVLRRGNGPLLVDLMERGLLGHLALNGAGAIHDFELALIGQTCESVARYVATGEFGLWSETGRINDAAVAGYREGIGLGEAIGRMIEDKGFPYRQTSVLAAGARLGVPVTVHVAIGQDIIHEHRSFDPAATGATSYTDFLIFAESVTRLEGGVFLNLGTAVMGPEVYLKALAMARNVARQDGGVIRDFTTAVFDLVPREEFAIRSSQEAVDANGQRPPAYCEPEKTNPRYYFRPYKTVLVRTVADGGASYYVQGDHRLTIPALYDQIIAGAAG